MDTIILICGTKINFYFVTLYYDFYKRFELNLNFFWEKNFFFFNIYVNNINCYMIVIIDA